MDCKTYNKVVSSYPARALRNERLVQEKYPWLENTPLFAGLAGAQASWLACRLYPCACEAGQDIMITGMPGDKVYIILSGTVKVYAPQPDGTDVIVAIFGPGDVVGELSLASPGGRSASVVALEPTRMLWMSKADLREALRAMPDLALNLIDILANRLRLSTGQIQALATLEVIARVSRQILAFADTYGVSGPGGEVLISIRLTQNDLAGLVGASRKRVNQAVVALKKEKFISIDERYYVTVLDRPQLEKYLR